MGPVEQCTAQLLQAELSVDRRSKLHLWAVLVEQGFELDLPGFLARLEVQDHVHLARMAEQAPKDLAELGFLDFGNDMEARRRAWHGSKTMKGTRSPLI